MSECGAIAELRDLDREDLEFACKVNNRSLVELLKEYNRSYAYIITTNVEVEFSTLLLLQLGKSNQKAC